MDALRHQRCFNHALREAAARCPGCGRFFCRECVTEHEGRVLCAACLRERVRRPRTRRGWVRGLARAGAALWGLWLAWLFFHLLGQALLAVPSAFHEGTIWRERWLGGR